MQFYIVSGGRGLTTRTEDRRYTMASTEVLKKDGGTSWQIVASLPSVRHNLRGVSLPNGHFMVSGEDVVQHLPCFMALYYASFQEDMITRTVCLTCWTMIPSQTNGPRWASSPQPASGMAWASCPRRLLTTVSDNLGTEIFNYDFISFGFLKIFKQYTFH